MNRISTKNLLLICLLVPTLVLSGTSLARRYHKISLPPRTYTPLPPITPITIPKPSVPTPKPMPTPTQTPSPVVPTPTPAPTPSPIPNNNGLKKSTYLWGKFDPNTINSIIDGASSNGISIIYLDIEPYVYGTNSVTEAVNQLSKVVQYAKSKDVSIHGLIGAPSYAQPLERQFVLKALDIIKQFNATQSQPISGIHLNIEFYNIPEFKTATNNTTKNTILTNYLDFHKIIAQEVRNIQSRIPQFQLSSTLPHFTDFQASDNPIPFINYDGSNMSVFEQVAKVLNSTPNSTIVIMSYRSVPTGPNSIADLVKNEFSLIAKYNTKITIAVETHNENSTLISLYGKSKKEISDVINLAVEPYKSSRNFDGVAIHEIKDYLSAR